MNAPHHTQTRYAKHLATLAALSLGIAAHQASAADVTWLGNTSNLWNTGANWSTSAIPTSGSTLVFGAPGTAGVALSDDITGLTAGGAGTDGIVFGSAAGSYTITRPAAQTITLGSSAGGIAVKNTSLFLQTLSVPMTSLTDQTVQVGDTTGAALSSLTTGSSGWTGGFRLTKTGTGLLTLGSSNVISGLTINQGTINVGADSQLSATAPSSATAGWLVLNGGTLRTNVNAGWTLNANRGIALGDGTPGSGGTINVTSTNASAANTLALTYNGIIADNGGTNSLTKTGIQILALGGANTYTGATKINQGQLTLDFGAAGAPASNIINSASNLVMGDYATSLSNSAAGAPVLLVQGGNSAANSQTFNGASFKPGNSNVIARGGTGAFATTLALGAITHTPGGTVGFSLINNGGTAAITTSTANTNGIIGGFATTGATAVGTGTTPVTQTDWAANDGSNNIVAYTGYTLATTTTGTPVALASNAANNVRISSASTGNITLTFASNLSELNTIQSTDTVARTLVIGAGNTLRLGNFGGVWTASTGTLTFGASTAQGGTLTAGGATNTAGEIVFNTGAGITVNSVIADNGSGAVSLVKTGTSTLTLNGNNTFTGGTFINQGTVTAISANSFGGAGRDVTVLTGATVNLGSAGGLTYANNFNLAGTALSLGGVGGATITTVGNTVSGTVTLMGDTTVGGSGTNGTISGKITGDYNFSVLGGLTLTNTANDYTGHFGVNGILGPLGGNPVTVKLGADEVLANGAGKGNVYISGSSTAGNYSTLDLNGRSETVNGLVSAGTAAQVRVTNTSATASTLTLGDNDQTATYAGTIIDGTGTVRIVKIGQGVQTFSGLNTYTGGTAVDAGTLAIANTFTMSGANRIGIAAAGLAGTNYATVRSTSGTLTFGGTLGINVTASLSGGESFNLFTANGGTLAGDFSNVSLTGSYIASLTNNGSGIWTGTTNGLDFTFSTSGINAGILSVAVSSVPEPSTYAALFGTLVLGIAVMQRRRSKKSV